MHDMRTIWQDVVGDDAGGFWRQAIASGLGIVALFSVMRRLGWK